MDVSHVRVRRASDQYHLTTGGDGSDASLGSDFGSLIGGIDENGVPCAGFGPADVLQKPVRRISHKPRS